MNIPQIYPLSKLMRYCFSSDKAVRNAVYIVAAKRTPIGSFLGRLSKFTATDLGGFAIRAAVESIKLDVKEIDEVILGNVIGAGLGQAPARQASIKGGLDIGTPCTTVNKVCSSGIKTICYGAQSIALGDAGLVVAGGFESMSRAPFLVHGFRSGVTHGNQPFLDSVHNDGLMDAFLKTPMGTCAEKTAEQFKITRQQQDEFCKHSYRKHIAAAKAGLLLNELTGIKIKEKNKQEQIFQEDEEYHRYREDKIATLSPVFLKTGTITAGNASKMNDGACAIILASEEKVKKLGLKPLARIVNYADAEIAHIDFSIAPQYACKKVLAKAGLSIGQMDFFQFNEAFSLVPIVNAQLLDISQEKVNIYGGAVAMGHPIGMSGARLIQSLLTVLSQRGGKYGLAAICNGGGGSTAMIIENLQ